MEPEANSNSDINEVAGRASQLASPSEREAQAGDGQHTSRPPSNLHTSGGEDYLTLSLYLHHANFLKASATLNKLRSKAESGRKDSDEFELNGHRFLMLPMGAKVGTKRSKAYFRWQFQSETGFKIQIMNRESCQEDTPNGKLEATSLVLMRHGVEEVVRQTAEALSALGITVARNKVSRVDVCCDLPGRKIDALKQAFEARHYISQGNYGDTHYDAIDYDISEYGVYHVGLEPTSINLGRGNVRMRIYEKVRECKSNLEKLQTLIERRWGVFPYRAIRTEFQLRRGKLTKLGIDHFGDWMSKRASVVHYLTHSWIRFTDGEYNPKHPERAKILPEWIEVQNAFAAWVGSGPQVELGPIETKPMPPNHYVKSAIGSFISLCAKLGLNIDTNETFWNEVLYFILDDIEDRDIPAEVQRRILELGVAKSKEERC